jgi:hypothetical protein
MAQTPINEELLAYATGRCERAGAEIGAAFDRDLTEPDRDEARRWRFLIVDRVGGAEYVEFLATRIGRGVLLPVEPLEDAVEHFVVCGYPAEGRLAALKADSEGLTDPIVLPLAERHRRQAAVSA